MGKGKRGRARRRADSAPAVPRDFPFVVDATTARKLGPDGLDEVAQNLWAKDCQTCGWPLGEAAPALVVDDMVVMLSVHLHHPRCRSAQWAPYSSFRTSSAALVSYDIATFLMQGERRDQSGTSATDDRPVFFVNPGLESVLLTQEDGRWSANLARSYRQLGFGVPFDDFVVDRPVEDVVARLDGSDVTIAFEEAPVHWECSGDVPWREAVRDLGGVTVAITHAAIPSQPRTVAEFVELMRSGRIVMGWVRLEGAAQPLPPTSELPESMGTYVLHYGPGDASVGELLATAGPDIITRDQAQRWAESFVTSGADEYPEGRMMWRQGKDPAVWRMLDAVSVSTYDIRFTDEGWQLVRLFSQMGGPTFRDQEEATTWGTRASKNLGRVRVIGWKPAPGTGHPDYVTLIGAGQPR